ncbi:FAD binding domain-containing protein [Actinokineospora sp. NPDC004072]
MEFMRPWTLAQALAMKADAPDAVPIAGGTDVMVEINFDKRRPGALLDLSAVAELSTWDAVPGGTRIGATLPYSAVVELGARAPGLAAAARTVGSPQIRNRGSVGGNLGSASPAGDAHPPLLADGSTVEIASARGRRSVPAREFFVGPKKSVLEPDELITAVVVPEPRGPQQFAKVGTRNAMVIAVCSFALALDVGAKVVGTGIGSAGPTPLRAVDAERFAAGLDWDADLPPAAAERFGELVAAAARPIDDVRGSAAYRRHALGVVARRTLTWAWAEYRRSACG